MAITQDTSISVSEAALADTPATWAGGCSSVVALATADAGPSGAPALVAMTRT